MSMIRAVALVCALLSLLAFTACGYHEVLISVTVTPKNGIATSGSNNNTVQFTATGNYGSDNCGYQYDPCVIDKTQPLTNATWSTSDSANTSIDSKGLATCLSPTLAAQIVGSGQGPNGLISGKAILCCN